MPEFRGATLQEVVHRATTGFRAPRGAEADLLFKKLDKSDRRYPFVRQARRGDMLLVGEGNFSFALSLARSAAPLRHRLVATTIEAEAALTEDAETNAHELVALGAEVGTRIDATRLSEHFSGPTFDLIAFQFPNAASRVALYGQNASHWLVTRFFRSAREHLRPSGEIVVSTVDNAYYEGVFKMAEAARKAGFPAPDILDFDPGDFPGYRHENTLGGTSALRDHRAFATFVFRDAA